MGNSNVIKLEKQNPSMQTRSMRIYRVMPTLGLLTTKPDWDARWLFVIFIWMHFILAMILTKPFDEMVLNVRSLSPPPKKKDTKHEILNLKQNQMQ